MVEMQSAVIKKGNIGMNMPECSYGLAVAIIDLHGEGQFFWMVIKADLGSWQFVAIAA